MPGCSGEIRPAFQQDAELELRFPKTRVQCDRFSEQPFCFSSQLARSGRAHLCNETFGVKEMPQVVSGIGCGEGGELFGDLSEPPLSVADDASQEDIGLLDLWRPFRRSKECIDSLGKSPLAVLHTRFWPYHLNQ